MIVAFVVSLVSLYALACYPNLARTVPTNYALLGVFTVSEAYIVACITTFYTPMSVLNAALLTTAIVIGLTVYAFKTTTDFTYYGGLLFMASFGLLMAMFLGIFINSNWFQIMISLFAILLFGVYLIYDTQLIMGGEGKSASYTIDDYILGAINIYLDIINIFVQILKIIGNKE